VLLFNLLIGTRWSFHVFNRVLGSLATSGRRIVIVGADTEGQAALMYLYRSAEGPVSIVGMLDDDEFKRGKLFHGYPVLGTIRQIGAIYDRLPFDEILIAQRDLSDMQIDTVAEFATSHELIARRLSLDSTAIGTGSADAAAQAPAFAAARPLAPRPSVT
jgi:FlaA1/EpsC-like NDP-sugar epimerase